MTTSAQGLERAPSGSESPALRIAICGEVNAGKSTVLNALLRGHVLPDNVGATARPLIEACYRPHPGADLLYPDGRHDSVALSEIPARLPQGTRVLIWSDEPRLQGLEFVEIPATTAEAVTPADLALLKDCDALIWVTIASQAWRLTEKAILARFEEVRPAKTLLVVSRADKLRNRQDRDKLEGRIRRETAGMFDDCIFLNGARATISGARGSDEAWKRSGALGILDHLHAWHGTDPATLLAPAPREPENLIDLAAFRQPVDEVAPAAVAVVAPAAVAAPPVATPVAPQITKLVPAAPAAAAAPTPRAPAPAKDRAPAPPAAAQPLAQMRQIMAQLPPGAVAGVLTTPGHCEVLSGDSAECQRVGAILRGTVESLRASYGGFGLDTDLATIALSSPRACLMCEALPDGATAFLMADARLLNVGIAKALMERLVQVATEPARSGAPGAGGIQPAA